MGKVENAFPWADRFLSQEQISRAKEQIKNKLDEDEQYRGHLIKIGLRVKDLVRKLYH